MGVKTRSSSLRDYVHVYPVCADSIHSASFQDRASVINVVLLFGHPQSDSSRTQRSFRISLPAERGALLYQDA